MITRLQGNIVTDKKIQPVIVKQHALPYQMAQLPNGESLSYRVFGQGKARPPFILIHGNLTSFHIWDPLYAHLKDNQQHQFYTLELRGFGRSTYNTPVDNIDNFVEDVAHFMDKVNVPKAILVGMSFGGAVALKFALAHPHRADRLVLLECISLEGFPPYTQKNPLTNVSERIRDVSVVRAKQRSVERNLREKNKDFIRIFYAGGVMSHAQNKVHASDIDFLLEETLLQRNYAQVAVAMHFFNIGVNGTREIKFLQCPVLVYHGEEDVLIPVQTARDNHKQIGKKKSILIVKRSAGHAITFEHPRDFARTLVTFADMNFKHFGVRPML